MEGQPLSEYETLRATIRQRGTVRVLVAWLGVGLWAACVLVIAAAIQLPALSLVPLLVLVASFEAVFALHTGAERVGRYLQVFHGDAWEETAMAYGRRFRGAGPDALFSAVFALAALVNLLPIVSVDPTPAEWIPLGLAHLLFLLRIDWARRQAAGQRTRDLERFRALALPSTPSGESGDTAPGRG
jgi:hypothetical protein